MSDYVKLIGEGLGIINKIQDNVEDALPNRSDLAEGILLENVDLTSTPINHGSRIRCRTELIQINSPYEVSGAPGPVSLKENHSSLGRLAPLGWNFLSKVTLSASRRSTAVWIDADGCDPLFAICTNNLNIA